MVSTESMIKDYLSKFDKVEFVDMPRYSNTGVLKGYAKVTLATSEGARKVIANNPHTIGGLEVGILKWQDPDSYLKKKNQESKRKVYVRIPFSITEDMLFKYFSTIGKVESVSIKTQPVTNLRRNFCYITFSNISAAKDAIRLSPHTVHERQLICEPSIRPNTETRHTNMEKRLKMGIFEQAQERKDEGTVTGSFRRDFKGEVNHEQGEKIPQHSLNSSNGTPNLQKISYCLDHKAALSSTHRSMEIELKQDFPRKVDWRMAHSKPTSRNYPKDSIATLDRRHLNPTNIRFNLQALR